VGLEGLSRFSALFDFGLPFVVAVPLGFVIAFDLEANFLSILGATFRGVWITFFVLEALAFLDLSFFSLLAFMDPSSDKTFEG
jgi:hypothetical protein